MSNIPYRISSKSITLLLGNVPKIIPSSHMNFDKVKEALNQPVHDIDAIRNLADIPAAIAIDSAGRVKVYDGEVHFEGQKTNNFLATRILDHVKLGLSIQPLMLFLDRLMLNPNEQVREDLFKWLESGDMPVTEDGCFVGYKYVQADYYSAHSGTNGKVLHALHTVVEMPRGECDESRYNTCSTGLHFCSYGYLSTGYASNYRIIIVKIAPEDVTAIPTDYHQQKGRCCKYEVIGEITQNRDDHYRGKVVVDSEATLAGVETVPEGATEAKETEATEGDIKTKLADMSFTHAKSGKKFKAFRVWKEITKKGQRAASKVLGVPRTTLQNWLAAINEAL